MLADDNSRYVYRVLSGHRSGVNCLDFCKDDTGNIFASGSDDGSFSVWRSGHVLAGVAEGLDAPGTVIKLS